jgi:ribosomal protein L27
VFHAGRNVGQGKDWTLYARTEGTFATRARKIHVDATS